MIPASAEEQGERAGASPAAPRLDIPLLRKDRRLWVWWHRGQSRRLVVVFSSVGHGPNTPPLLEFARTATADGQDNALFIADPQRSWLNAPRVIEDTVEAIDAARDEVGADETVTMGYSMGGFAALAITGFTAVTASLAFSPQMSIDPALVPDEGRWKKYRSRIAAVHVRAATDHMAAATQHTIIMGESRLEKPQLRLLPQAANTDILLLRRTGHDTATRIKQAGILPDVVALAFARRRADLAALLSDRLNARSQGAAA